MFYEETRTCNVCGTNYKLYKTKLPMRDKDSEDCEICGNTIISWNGGVMYRIEKVTEN